MKPCLKLILSLPDADQEKFASRVSRGMSLGFTQDEAKREAARMLMDDIKAEAEMVEKALREQHPGVFAEPVRASRDQTSTPEFKRWFGDSKVVDAQGKPLVVYHGTTADFAEFDPGMRGSSTRVADAKKGFFFVDSGKAASEYTWKSGSMVGNVMPVYLSMKDPLVVDMPGEWAPGKYDQVLDRAKSAGYDGVVIRGATTLGATGDVYIAFKPEQIKSAIGNSGAFDPANPDIRYSIEPGYSAEADPEVLRWLSSGRGDPGEVGVIYDKPIEALRMAAESKGIAGFTRFTGISRIGARHAMRDHSEITAEVLASALAGLQSPRLIVDGGRKEDGRHAMVLVTPVNVGPGDGLPVLVAINSGKRGTDFASVALVATSYGKENSAAWVAAQIKAGKVVYADEAELGRLARYQRALKLPSIQRMPGGKTTQVPAFSVLTSANLGKFVAGQKGWNKGVVVEPAAQAADIGVGAKFSRDEGRFELPEFGPGSRAQLALQDRYNRWKQAVQAVREQGGNVNEYNDFYLAEERYWGRVGAQNEAFGKEVEDFVEAVKKDGLTLQDVAEYVYAKHAAERNAYVAKMRDDMEGTGSGMTNDEADEILRKAEESGKEALLMKHATTLYDWIDGTRQVMLENGLISEAEANSWEGMFTHYVPLRGLEGKEPQGKGTGSGFNIKGRESKQITGRRSKAKQIIEQIIQDRTKAYIRAGKNEVLRTFLNFALENPSPNLWKVSAVETKPTVVVDEFGNRTVEQREMLVSDPRRVVSLKDGGQTIHIEVKDQELLKQLQNGYATTPVAPVAAMLWANRTVGAMLTAFSPVFVAMNAVRDAQTALFGMIGVKGYKGAGNLALQYPGALREAFKAHFGEPSAEYREYLLAGGTTGYFGLKELDETGEELAALMRNAERSPINPIKVGKALAKFVENVNGVVEQTTRFAAYRAAKRSGSTVAESASISKNLTVNFNRKGSLASFTGAAVLFFNPAVQGTARLAQAMKSPKVWGALGGASAGVFFLALANADLGGEDDDGVSFWDKVPREVKERNLVIMRPPVRKEDGTLESRYIKIPVAYGYNVFLVAAYEMADAIRHRDDKTKGREPMESASRVATAFLGATLPVQALGQSLGDSSALTMAPYSNALGPVAQALANKSGFGRPLYPETQNTKYLPDSQKFSVGQAGTIFQKAAEKLNEAAGGDKFTSSGWLTDIAPGSLENAARFYGGGLTSMTLDIMNAFYVRQHIERPEPDLKRLPFVKQFYGSINDETDRWFAYERMNKAERATQPLEAAIRAGDAQAVETILKREPLAVAGKALDQIRQSLSDIRKAELAIIQDPDLKDGERYVRLMEQSKNAREVLRQWNTVYDDLNKRQEPAR